MKRTRTNSCCVFIILAAIFGGPVSAQAAFFNYLYIEASEGNSSGGHSAIQFGDDIYHYQHMDSGLIRLFRRGKEDFHFLYRYLQNRPIHESRIEVSGESFRLIQDHFKWLFLTQDRVFRLFDDLNKDRIFIRHVLRRITGKEASGELDESSVLQLKGVGLFFPDQKDGPSQDGDGIKQISPAIQQLRLKLEQRYGPDFLQHRRQDIESRIRSMRPSRWPDMKSELTGQKLPPPIYSWTDRYLDAVTALFAIKVIAEARPLQSDAYFQMNQPDFKLADAERKALLNLRSRLETRFLQSINSARPDWGYAALVNLARFLAVDSSLQSGFWIFIDDFAVDSPRARPDDYLHHRGHIRTLLSDARAVLDSSRQWIVPGRPLSESAYSAFEMNANRYFELLKSQKRQDFRFNGEKALPTKSVGLSDAIVPHITREQLTTALAELDRTENRLFQQLKHHYRYDLVSRNCVTELFRSIDQALLNSRSADGNPLESDEFVVKESKKRLGGYVSARHNFIPFVSYQAVRNHYHVSDSRDLNSFRGLELAKLKDRQNGLMAAITESNIITSRLYHYNSDDALFVFFTDDNVPLRPLFGVFNSAAAISQSLYGIFSWPFDSGKNLKSGAKGLLMSLPELFFVNMRKGSYKYLSVRRMAIEG